MFNIFKQILYNSVLNVLPKGAARLVFPPRLFRAVASGRNNFLRFYHAPSLLVVERPCSLNIRSSASALSCCTFDIPSKSADCFELVSIEERQISTQKYSKGRSTKGITNDLYK